jgi:hypothetical protein
MMTGKAHLKRNYQIGASVIASPISPHGWTRAVAGTASSKSARPPLASSTGLQNNGRG